MNVLGIKLRVRGQSGVFEGMRVWPLNGWNIWNINFYKKNIYIKHIDRQQTPITPDRNMLDHTGTTLRSLFCKCSTKGIYRNTSLDLVNQGLQRTFRKSRSAMFRLAVLSTYRPESLVNRGLAAFNF